MSRSELYVFPERVLLEFETIPDARCHMLGGVGVVDNGTEPCSRKWDHCDN